MLKKLKSLLNLENVLNTRSVILYLYLKYFKSKSRNTYNFKLRNDVNLLVTPLQGDLCTFHEIFVEEVYHPDIATNGYKKLNILDIGANVGYFSIYASKKFTDASIFSFEPFYRSLNIFNKHLGMNAIKNVNPYPFAVSDRCGETTLYSIDWTGCNTIIPNKFDEGYYNRNKVESINLEKLFEITGIDTFDLAKIDCEGSEYQILLNSKDDVIRKIKNFMIEVHKDKNYNAQDLVNRFMKLNYEVKFDNSLLRAKIIN